jgi:Sec-independent protein translocase protein TatA
VYKLIFEFVIPVYKTTRQFKKGFMEMQDRMNEHVNQQQSTSQNNPMPSSQKPAGDYIDFEEIK